MHSVFRALRMFEEKRLEELETLDHCLEPSVLGTVERYWSERKGGSHR